MNKGFVYILRLKNNKFYTRLHQHKLGNVKATQYLRPVKIEFFQEYDSIDLARKIGHRLKRFKRKDFIEKIIKDGLIRMGP